MSIGERIRQIRLAHDLTQDEFGKRISLVSSMICQLENNTAKLTDRTAKSICNEYCINYDWLMYGKGQAYNEDKFARELSAILRKYPSVYATAKMVSSHMTCDDWKRANDLLQEMGE